MKTRKAIHTLITALACMAVLARAADPPADDYDGPSIYGDMFSEVLVSPRSAALSSSDLAVNAAGPIASNPALAARCKAPELTLSYSSYYGDVFSTSIVNYTSKIGQSGGISATAAYLLIPGIEDTRNVDIGAVDPADIKTFSASDVWARVAYGHGFDTKQANIYAGAAATARRRSLGESTFAYGLGADLGAMAFFPKPSVYAALLLENAVHSGVNWQDSGYSEKIQPHLRLSLAYEREDQYIYGRIALYYTSPDLLSNEGINAYADEMDREEGREPEARKLGDDMGLLFSAGRYGIEYTIMNTLSLRVGLNTAGYSMGAGLNLFGGRAGADFCYISHELAGTVKMSVTYRWM
ncbi:MAG: hypothetical protein FWB85_02445 [Chitinispirillia bacterium]|nr:hypothetical protein [Chitinispirillia bacterium]